MTTFGDKIRKLRIEKKMMNSIRNLVILRMNLNTIESVLRVKLFYVIAMILLKVTFLSILH